MNLKHLWAGIICLLSLQSNAQDIFTVTAYSHGCTMSIKDKDGVFKRASDGSEPVYNKTIATDWTILKPGTEVIIEGIGIWKANDRSGSIINGKYINNGRIKGKHIDLFVGMPFRSVKANCKFAKEWGSKKLKVWIIPKASTKWSTYNN